MDGEMEEAYDEFLLMLPVNIFIILVFGLAFSLDYIQRQIFTKLLL